MGVDKLADGLLLLGHGLGLLLLLAQLEGGALRGPELVIRVEDGLDLAADDRVLVVLAVEEDEGGK